jgi:hypothetical protein
MIWLGIPQGNQPLLTSLFSIGILHGYRGLPARGDMSPFLRLAGFQARTRHKPHDQAAPQTQNMLMKKRQT